MAQNLIGASEATAFFSIFLHNESSRVLDLFSRSRTFVGVISMQLSTNSLKSDAQSRIFSRCGWISERSAQCVLLAFSCILLVAVSGCSKKELDDMMNKAKETVDSGAKSVQDKVEGSITTTNEKLGLSGTIAVTLDKTEATDACYASFINFQETDRPNVLKLQSYSSLSQESYPSALIQAQTDRQSIEQLSGQTVSAQMFFKPGQYGAIWYTQPTEPIQLKINSTTDGKVIAEFAGGKLYNTATGASVTPTGRVEGKYE
jgi:hypothetical protein